MTMALSMSWRVECCAFYDLPGAKYQLLGGVDVEQHHLITPLGCFFPLCPRERLRSRENTGTFD